MRKINFKKFLVLVSLFLFLAGAALIAEETGKISSVYEYNLQKYRPLAQVNSSEYKFLLNPAFFANRRIEGYKKVWERVKSIAMKNGYKIEEAEDPFKEKLSTKEYMDTSKYTIRKKGYVIRRAEKYKSGKPSGKYKYTGKFISRDLYKVLASDFSVAPGIKHSTEIEDNVSLDKNGNFKHYFEIAQKIKSKKKLGYRLKDYGKFYPKLLKIGLSPDTPLRGKKAYSYKVEPGKLVLDDKSKVEIEIEVWTHKENGRPFVAECSYTLEIPDYYSMGKTIKRAENFLKLLGQNASDLVFPNFDRYNGSKVRVLLNMPVR